MNQITSGSPRELWRISLPLMISFLSLMVMLFVDRLFLSWYSNEALTAAVQSGTLSWGVILGWITMASMSEVFASQYNGAKQYKLIGIPVWQMIWLALASAIFYIPFAYYATGLIYDPISRPLEYDYFQVMMFAGPIFSLVPAISGFFIGRGRTQILQWMSFLGNGINIVLDPILIFGIEGYVPSLGIKGAAIATAIGTFVQALVLFLVFINRRHRDTYDTLNCAINWKIFFKTIKVGLPPSIFVMAELFGWALFYHMMMMISDMHIYVAGVVQSVLMLFFFFGMGLEKGCIAVAGNLIGSKEPKKVKRIISSGLKLNLIYIAIIAVPMVIYPDPMINWFIGNGDFFDHASGLMGAQGSEIFYYIRIGLLSSLFLVAFENMRWVLNGVLTAAGDTLFLLIAGVICVWGFMVLPTYLLVVLPKASITVAFTIWASFGFFSVMLLFFRFQQGKWKNNQLIEATSSKSSDDLFKREEDRHAPRILDSLIQANSHEAVSKKTETSDKRPTIEKREENPS